MTHSNEAGLQLIEVSKTFGTEKVVNSVSFEVKPGQVLGLVGENGAGKSTLLKLACGLEKPDSGEVLVRGIPFQGSLKDSLALGSSMVFQEQALIPQLTVYENIFLGLTSHFSTMGVLKHRLMKSRAKAVLEGLIPDTHIQVGTPLERLSFGERQLVEIVRAFAVAEIVGAPFPIILLDEATASLSRDERQILFSLVRSVQKRAAIVFVSHILSEIREVCDSVLILKDGKYVASGATGNFENDQLHELITGRSVPASMYLEERQGTNFPPPTIECHNLELPGVVGPVSFAVSPGEIVGIGGVVGSGKENLGRILAGESRKTRGVLKRSVRTRPAYVPRERLSEGITLGKSVAWNITVDPIFRGEYTFGPVLRLKDERAAAVGLIEAVDVRPKDPSVLIDLLSGGNQQKAVMARWLARRPDFLVLDSPTRGVDVGSREAIYLLVRNLAERGCAIVLISDDLNELIGLSNRIFALKDGHQIGELDAPAGLKPTEAQLIEMLV